MTTKEIIGIIVFMVLAFGAGMGLGVNMKFPSSSTVSNAPITKNQENTYQAGWDAAKKRLERNGMLFPAGMEIKSLQGTIASISGNKISIKNATTINILADPSLDDRTVQIGTSTKIYTFTMKDQAQFQKEYEAYQEKVQKNFQNGVESDPALVPPSPQIRKDLSLADLKVGQVITVTSEESIGEKREFTASIINVNPSIEPANPVGKVPPVPTPPANGNAPAAPSAPVSSGTNAAIPTPPASPTASKANTVTNPPVIPPMPANVPVPTPPIK